MTEETLAAAIKAIRNYTALPAWAAEFMTVFAICIAVRFWLGVWIFDAVMAGGGSGPAAGAMSPAAAAAGGRTRRRAVVARLAARLRQPAELRRQRYNCRRGFHFHL